VPETLLWTLYDRAAEARRPHAVLHDPLAVERVRRLDYPFEQRFGEALGMTAGEERRLAGLGPNIVTIEPLRLPRGRGALHAVLPIAMRVPAIGRLALSVVCVRCGG
jgi:hypothetical protein